MFVPSSLRVATAATNASARIRPELDKGLTPFCPSNATLATVLSNSGAWTNVSFNTSAWAGQTVVLWFNDHGDGYPTDPTYFLVDDVSIS